MKKDLSRAVSLALTLLAFLTIAPLAAEPAASTASPQDLARALGLKAPCAAGAQNLPSKPEHRMAWWPDLCGACSDSPQCVGLLVLDIRGCDPGDGSRGTCRNYAGYCTEDADPDDNRDEVNCACDFDS
jgi:hypothetical protein